MSFIVSVRTIWKRKTTWRKLINQQLRKYKITFNPIAYGSSLYADFWIMAYIRVRSTIAPFYITRKICSKMYHLCLTCIFANIYRIDFRLNSPNNQWHHRKFFFLKIDFCKKKIITDATDSFTSLKYKWAL